MALLTRPVATIGRPRFHQGDTQTRRPGAIRPRPSDGSDYLRKLRLQPLHEESRVVRAVVVLEVHCEGVGALRLHDRVQVRAQALDADVATVVDDLQAVVAEEVVLVRGDV